MNQQYNAGSGYTDPVRYPQAAAPGVRTKRAFILLLLTLVIPGAAQVVAGDRRLGRRALKVTFTAWAVAIAAVVLALTNRALVIDILTHGWASFLVMIILAVLAVAWALLFLNTLRIIRPPLLERGVRPLVSICLALLMIATSGSLAYGAYLLNVSRQTFGSIFASGPSLDPVDGRYNFLLMGGDAGEDRTGLRPDSISMISVDAKTGQPVTFSIPRNFQNAQFPADSPLNDVYPTGYDCGDECIINSLYQTVTENYADLYPGSDDPGAEAMMDAVSGTLGLEVQGYVIVDMEGFSHLIDAMGGIKINSGGWVPITAGEIPGTNRHYPPDGWIPPGVQTLDGYHALWYARSREFVTDYHRISRQQCVQQAMIAQMDPATLLTRFQAIATAGEEIVETDLPQDQLGSFVDLALKAKGLTMQRMTIGPPDFGSAAENFVTYPDFNLIHARVQDFLAGTESSPVEPDPAPAPAEEAAPEEAAPAEAAPDAGTDGEAADGTPLTEVPQEEEAEITVEYLQYLAEIGDDVTLGSILNNNGECSPG
ncbi:MULTISPECIES: LCP family protein [unclassified Arthrobacter]|uniref:LCP family protein n=1 Tax=unclassified Arthrobacter TaxID=235627 RepID=UPI001E2D6A57|nr:MULTISPECIES: LCP family protein [unclassified Arthrobacter]MCC9146106.1 LCP family protein [Arthrobacter sp. zg-Y919]MDK1277335.1 LCP family protein [Arthrobacter sp. zg.Y919]WIB03836.1 LCP family protein [Arthrobacter sp. zg-Y919]